MTTKQKLERIDAYLAEDNIEPAWGEMIREYRDILKARQKGSGSWKSINSEPPEQEGLYALHFSKNPDCDEVTALGHYSDRTDYDEWVKEGVAYWTLLPEPPKGGTA